MRFGSLGLSLEYEEEHPGFEPGIGIKMRFSIRPCTASSNSHGRFVAHYQN